MGGQGHFLRGTGPCRPLCRNAPGEVREKAHRERERQREREGEKKGERENSEIVR